MFTGQYTHTLDEKNRLSLPVKFRKEVGKKIMLTPGLDGCVFGFSLKEWGSISEKLGESSMLQSDARSFNRYMFGGAVEAEVDAIGRILVPDFLRDRSGLKGKVVIVGVRNRIEIWNEKQWIAFNTEVDKKADALAEKLGQVGIL